MTPYQELRSAVVEYFSNDTTCQDKIEAYRTIADHMMHHIIDDWEAHLYALDDLQVTQDDSSPRGQ
jgi:hypothetical protein